MTDESVGPGVFALGESSIKPEWTAEGRVLLDIDRALTAALEEIREERDEALAALSTARAAAVDVLEGCWDQLDGMVIDEPESQAARARAMRAITKGIKELTEAGPSLAVASECVRSGRRGRPTVADDVYEGDVQAVAELLARSPRWSAADTARAAVDILIARETRRQDEFVEQQVAEANLLGMDITDKGLGVRVTMARQTAAHLVLAAKAMLDAHPGAENYIEQTVWDRHPETGEPLDRYIVTFHKPRGRSAHELRQVAERERDEALAALAECRARAEGADRD